jgi:hypothetical protein
MSLYYFLLWQCVCETESSAAKTLDPWNGTLAGLGHGVGVALDKRNYDEVRVLS